MNYTQRVHAGNNLRAMIGHLPEKLRNAFVSYIRNWRLGKLTKLTDELSVAKEGIPKLSPNGQLAVKILAEWASDQEEQSRKNRDPKYVKQLQLAADRILRAYGDRLHPDYAKALRRTFHEPRGHTHCFACYHTREDWAQRLYELGVPESQRATTYAHTGPARGFVRYNVTSFHPPEARRIDFPFDVTDSTVVHEMLHWCCHEDFRWGSFWRNMLQADTDTVNEGITEYLTRKIMGDTDGGYKNMMDYVNAALERNRDLLAAIYPAYFKGTNAADVVMRVKRDIDTAVSRFSDYRLGVLAERWKQLREANILDPTKPEVSANRIRQLKSDVRHHKITYDELTYVMNGPSAGPWVSFLQDVCSKE
jgi:hypothetical protein